MPIDARLRNKTRAPGLIRADPPVRSGACSRAPRLSLLLLAAAGLAPADRARGAGRRGSAPVDGAVLRAFALGRDPYAAGWHRGVDLAAARGSPVRSACAGTGELRRSRAARRADRERPLRRDRRDVPAARLGRRSRGGGRRARRAARRRRRVERPARAALARAPRRSRGWRPAAISTRSTCCAARRPAMPLLPPAGGPGHAPRRWVPRRPRRVPRRPARRAPRRPRARAARRPARCPGCPRARRPARARGSTLAPVDTRAAPPGGFEPRVPWTVWIGLACVGLGLPFGGFVRLRRRGRAARGWRGRHELAAHTSA